MSRRSELTTRTAAGLAWTASGKLIGAVLQIVVLAALARLLAPADFGIVTAALIVVTFFSMVSRLGLGHALVQSEELDDAHVSTAYWTSLTLGLALALFVWLTAPLAATFFRIPAAEPVLRALAWLFPLRAVVSIGESLLQRAGRFGTMARLEIVAYGIGYGGAGIGAAVLGLGYWSLVIAHYAEAILTLAIVISVQEPVRLSRPDYRILQRLLGYGGGVTLGKFINQVALQIDNVVVGRMLGAGALGLYGRAYQLMAMPGNLLGEALDRVLFPAMARIRLDRPRLTRVFFRGLAAVGLATLPASLLVIVLAPELVVLVLGEQWREVIAPFQVLALGFFFRTSYRISDSLAYATGAVYRRALRQLAYALSVGVGAWIGTRYGITGVAAGVLGALMVNFALMSQLSLNVLDSSWRKVAAAQAPGLRAAAVVGVASLGMALLLRSAEMHPSVVVVGTSLASFAAITAAVARFPRAMLGEDLEWVVVPVFDRVAVLGARLRATWPRTAAKAEAHPPAQYDITEIPAAAGRMSMSLGDDGITERIVELRVELPKQWQALDTRIAGELRRYLPLKAAKADWRRSAMSLTRASITLRDPGLISATHGLADVVEAYRNASAAAGRSTSVTEERISDIERYIHALERGVEFPPILLYISNGALLQLDGARRVVAHLAAGRSSLPALIVCPLDGARR
jgi:O-antigen/teichoic acid export membrane protein